jgi:hypothetical protein
MTDTSEPLRICFRHLMPGLVCLLFGANQFLSLLYGCGVPSLDAWQLNYLWPDEAAYRSIRVCHLFHNYTRVFPRKCCSPYHASICVDALSNVLVPTGERKCSAPWNKWQTKYASYNRTERLNSLCYLDKAFCFWVCSFYLKCIFDMF